MTGPKVNGTGKERLFELEVVTLDRRLFWQIEPAEIRQEETQDVIADAATDALCLVIDSDGEVWLIIQGPKRLWRWLICEAHELQRAISEYPFIGELEQIFLVAKRRKRKSKK